VPLDVKGAQLDGGPGPDLVCLCSATGASVISVFTARGGGAFNDAVNLPTIDRPKQFAIADLDGDGRQDLIAQALKQVAIHYGLGDGTFEPFVLLPEEATRSLKEILAVDMDGDGRLDLVTGDTRTMSVLIYHGKGGREFESPPFTHRVGVAPQAIVPYDVDGDQYLDLTVSSSTAQGIVISRYLGSEGYEAAVTYRMGVAASSHTVGDLDGDGNLDIAAFGGPTVAMRLGFTPGPPPPPRFRRGDADGNGAVQINDPVTVLNSLFREGSTIACEDAADVDDSGTINLTDAVRTLNWLFLEGEPPMAPGPLACGEDVVPDELAACQARCRS
jgi:hypothetical protein